MICSIDANSPVYRVIRVFSAHGENTKEMAEELDITLHYIQDGFNDLY